MALELRDLRTLVRSSHPARPNLVLTDEICKGTSSREGSCFFLSLLEWMDRRPFHAILATHLYEALDMPHRCGRVRLVRMRVEAAAMVRALPLEGRDACAIAASTTAARRCSRRRIEADCARRSCCSTTAWPAS